MDANIYGDYDGAPHHHSYPVVYRVKMYIVDLLLIGSFLLGVIIGVQYIISEIIRILT